MERDLIEGHKDTKVDADYVNKKLESMMAAIFDNMGENEERIKILKWYFTNFKRSLENGSRRRNSKTKKATSSSNNK